MIHDLRLEDHARRNGEAGVPAPEQRNPDGAESKVNQEITWRVQDARQKTTSEEKALRSAIKSRQLAPAVMRSNQIPEDCERALETAQARLLRDLSRYRRAAHDLEDEIREYQTAHGLTRGPRLADEEDRTKALTALIGFSLVQLVANAGLLAQGSAFGLAFGLGVAVLVAFFDIGLHFSLGRWGVRVVAPDTINRVVGTGATVLGAVMILAFNLATVHLRRISRASSGLALPDWDQWLPGLLSDPFGFNDYLSWVLFGVGILCSVLALGAGWIWDEPIPLLRRNGHRIGRLTSDIEDVEDELSDLVARTVRKYERDLDTLDRDAENHVAIVSDSVGRIRLLVADYESYCATARKTFLALVNHYRDHNRMHRNGIAVPEYFLDHPTIDFPDDLPISLAELDELERHEKGLYDDLKSALRDSREALRRLGQRADVSGSGATDAS